MEERKNNLWTALAIIGLMIIFIAFAKLKDLGIANGLSEDKSMPLFVGLTVLLSAYIIIAFFGAAYRDIRDGFRENKSNEPTKKVLQDK